MADTKNPAIAAASAEEEKQYRKQSLWHSFMGTLYGGLSGASFFGVLNKITTMLVDGAAPMGGALESSLIMGGLMTVGVVMAFMSQREWTEVAAIRDEHMARKNAECMAQQQAIARASTVAVVEPAVEKAVEKVVGEEIARNKPSPQLVITEVSASAGVPAACRG